MLRRRPFRYRHRPRPLAASVPAPIESSESTLLVLLEAKANTLAALEHHKKEGFDSEAEELMIGLAREAANQVVPDNFRRKLDELETRRQQFQERLDALKFFAAQFEKLLEKYRHEKPAELQRFLTAKIKEYEAQSIQPGAIAGDTAVAIERLQHELSALQKSAESRTKPKRKASAKSA